MSQARAHPVRLDDDRALLRHVIRAGRHSAQEVRRSRILLELDENDPDRQGPVATQAQVAERAGVGVETLRKVAVAYADRGGDVVATIRRKPRDRPPVDPKVTGDVEARIIAMACTDPPEGYTRWSLRLLEKHVGLTDDIPDLDHSTIGRVLKKRHFTLI